MASVTEGSAAVGVPTGASGAGQAAKARLTEADCQLGVFHAAGEL